MNINVCYQKAGNEFGENIVCSETGSEKTVAQQKAGNKKNRGSAKTDKGIAAQDLKGIIMAGFCGEKMTDNRLGGFKNLVKNRTQLI